ncbi:MAG TPA: hypothetical protein VGF85_02720 [Opitutaceae bacterium]|jgi:hypothetical protein
MNRRETPSVRDDAGGLRLLAGLNLAAGALCLTAIGFLYWHYLRMHAAFLDVAAWKKQADGGASLRAFFSVFVLYYRIGGALLAVGAIANLSSALFIRMRRHRFLSLAVACYDCLAVPFGTILGIFAIVLLLRDSVRRSYAGAEGSKPDAPS